jgi:hypothetical protein
MRERFKGAGEGHLLDALRRQELADGNLDIALAFKKCGELVEFAKGDKLIDQYGEDNDVFLLISGAVAIVVKGTSLPPEKLDSRSEKWRRSSLPLSDRRMSSP